ncbi:hypothetical protein KAI04_01555 [Candidatus Pacearchaeota archaeon]|nr:hypothetical protein [Candidatus Pacearchaeota archaeon]
MVNQKDKNFMKSFVKLYFKRSELEMFLEKDKKSLKYKEKVKVLDEMILKKLPQYPVLFDNDLKVLEKFFREVAKKEKATFFTNDFLSFLKWIIQRLHKEKFINKKTAKFLNSKMSKLDFKVSLSASILWQGR